MRPTRLLLSAALLLSACTNPRAEANMIQALNDAATQIGDLKNDVAQVQANVDSLRQVVAHQDTVIARIAEVNHIPTK